MKRSAEDQARHDKLISQYQTIPEGQTVAGLCRDLGIDPQIGRIWIHRAKKKYARTHSPHPKKKAKPQANQWSVDVLEERLQKVAAATLVSLMEDEAIPPGVRARCAVEARRRLPVAPKVDAEADAEATAQPAMSQPERVAAMMAMVPPRDVAEELRKAGYDVTRSKSL